MGRDSTIEWTTHTLNFWWGYMKVSPGCEHCYAETFSKRVGRNIWGPAKMTERWRTTGPWRDILKWDKAAKGQGIRQRVFCQSMSDFFEDHPQLDPWRTEACAILESLEWLDVQLLTKRPENVRRMVPAHWWANWPAHVWIGTSVEDQKRADERIPHLLDIPARIRFLSCEPLLGPLKIRLHLESRLQYYFPVSAYGQAEEYTTERIHWVIVGGESGPHARPFRVEWGIDLMEQCDAAGVPFFWKQMGDHLIDRHGERIRLAHKGGDWSEWPEEFRVREWPQGPKGAPAVATERN